MPRIALTCDRCGATETHMRGLTEDDPEIRCCGAVMYRDYKAESTGRLHTGVYHKPIEMHSVALHTPEEIAEFRKKAPDVEISADPAHPAYGVPVARTRSQKLQALRATGFEEK